MNRPRFNFGAPAAPAQPAAQPAQPAAPLPFVFGAPAAPAQPAAQPAQPAAPLPFVFGARPAAQPAFRFGAQPAAQPAAHLHRLVSLLRAIQISDFTVIRALANTEPFVYLDHVYAEHQKTPLQIATVAGKYGVMRLLLELHVDVNLPNSSGVTALHFAASKGWVEGIRLLGEWDASIDHTSNLGVTPLHAAVIENKLDAVVLLLELKASPEIRSREGSKPLETAIAQGYSEIADVLRRSRNDMLRDSLSLKDMIINIVKDHPVPGDSSQRLGVRDPFNLSLDSYSDDDKMGMFFRYGRDTIVSISYHLDSDEPRVAAMKASAPICAGQGRVIYSKLTGGIVPGLRRPKYLVYENSIDLTEERQLCHRLSSHTEKNWGCFKRTSPGDYYIVRSLIPLRIFRVQNGTDCTEVPAVRRLLWAYESNDNPFVKKDYPNLTIIERLFPSRGEDVGTFRGGTRGIEYGQEYLFVGHVTIHKDPNEQCFPSWYTQPTRNTGGSRMYFVFFYTIKLNNGVFSISRMSSCFHPPSPDGPHKIVFPVGIAERKPDEYVVSYGENDNDCRMALYTNSEINKLLAPVESWNENNYVFHPNYATCLRDSPVRDSIGKPRSTWYTMFPQEDIGLIATSPPTDKLFNPAITNAGDGKFVTAWRKFNGNLRTGWAGSNEVAMEVCSLEIKDGKLVYSTKNTPIEFQVGTTAAGGEDPRLMFFQDYCPLLLVNDLTPSNLRRMYIHNLKTDDSSRIVHPFCHNMSTSDADEKNWGPFEHEGLLHVVYSVTPLVIGKTDLFDCPTDVSETFQCERISESATPRNLQDILTKNSMVMRGGTPGIELDSGENPEYLFVGHSVQKHPRGGCFPDYIVQRFLENSGQHTHGKDVEDYNQQYMAFFYTIKKIGDEFKLHRISACSHFPGGRQSFVKIQFPSGLAKVNLGGIFENAFIVSVGVQDSHGVFCAFNREFLNYILRPVEHWDQNNYIVDVNYFQNVLNLNPYLFPYSR